MRSFVLALAALASLSVAVAASAQEDESKAQDLPENTERFLDLYVSNWTFTSPSLSPSGRYLAYLMRTEPGNANRVQIVVTDLDAEGGPTSVSTTLEDLWPTSVHWANENRILVGTEAPADNAYMLLRLGIRPVTTRIYSLDRGLTRTMMLFGNNRVQSRQRNRRLSNIVDMLPDEPNEVLMPAYRGDRLHLWRANIVNGEADLVERGTSDTIAWYAVDGEAVMRMDINLRARRLEIYTRSGRNGRWAKSFDIRPQDLPDTLPEFQYAGATGTPGEIFVLMRQETDEFIGIHRFDLATGEIVETVELLDDYDIASAWIEEATGDFIGYAYEADRRINVYRDDEVNRHIRALEAYFGDDITLTLISHHGRRLLLEADSPTEYGSIYLYHLDTQSAEPVFARWPMVSDVQLRQVEAVSYTARDGLEIPAFITWPEAGPGPDTPLIVMPHGGPEMRDAIRHDAEAQFFASLGYAVLQPNFRGSSGYGQHYLEAGHEEWGLSMQTDLDDGVMWLAETGQINPDAVCMVGFSYGGYAALMAAASQTGLYHCAVAGGAVSDLPTFLDDIGKTRSHVLDYWSDLLGDVDNPDDLARLTATSPVHLADRVDIPVYIFHGRNDSVVPIQQGHAMANALRQADIDHLYREGPGGHDWGLSATARRDQLVSIHEFIDTVLNGDIDALWDAEVYIPRGKGPAAENEEAEPSGGEEEEPEPDAETEAGPETPHLESSGG